MIFDEKMSLLGCFCFGLELDTLFLDCCGMTDDANLLIVVLNLMYNLLWS